MQGQSGAWSHCHVVAGLRDAIAAAVQQDNNHIIQAAWIRTGLELRRAKGRD